MTNKSLVNVKQLRVQADASWSRQWKQQLALASAHVGDDDNALRHSL